MARPLMPGDVVLANFPQHQPPDHEQEGLRPAVVVGTPDILGSSRYPVVLVVPLTTDHGQAWATQSPLPYPRLTPGVAGLNRDSLVLLDQVRSLGLSRLVRLVGRLPVEVYEPIQNGLLQMLGGSLPSGNAIEP